MPDRLIYQLHRASLIILPAVFLIILLDQWSYLYDTFNRGQVFGRDAYNLWSAGRILLEEDSAENIYNNAAFTAFQIKSAGEGIGWNAYFYPPPAFLTAALVGLAPYPIALPIYSLAGLAAFILAVSAPNYKRSIILLLLIAPMTSFNIIMGQNGLISAALLIGGLRLLSYRPSLAGVLFGLLAFKPILGLLIPPLLLIRRDWAAFISASLTVAISTILPILLWGQAVWPLFFSQAVEVQQNTLHHGIGIGMYMIPSAFNSARILGADTFTSYIVQALFSTSAIIIFIIYFIKSRKSPRSALSPQDILVFILATTIISPYIHSYDFSMIEGAILIFCVNVKDKATTPALSFLIVTCWYTGLLSLFGNMANIPFAPLALIIALCIVSRRMPIHTPVN